MPRILVAAMAAIIVGLTGLPVIISSAQTTDIAMISGSVTEDADGNGFVDARDHPAEALVVLLGEGCGDTAFSTGGKFVFEDLPVGDYTLYVYWTPGFITPPIPDGGEAIFDISAAQLTDGFEHFTIAVAHNAAGIIPFPVATGYGETRSCSGSAPSMRAGEQAPLVCPPGLPEERPERTVNNGEITVTLPAGRAWMLPENPPGVYQVCYVYAGVQLSADDCSELARSAETPDQHAILDRIVASCAVGPLATSTLTPTRSDIRPPDTGSGGLR